MNTNPLSGHSAVESNTTALCLHCPRKTTTMPFSTRPFPSLSLLMLLSSLDNYRSVFVHGIANIMRKRIVLSTVCRPVHSAPIPFIVPLFSLHLAWIRPRLTSIGMLTHLVGEGVASAFSVLRDWLALFEWNQSLLSASSHQICPTGDTTFIQQPTQEGAGCVDLHIS